MEGDDYGWGEGNSIEMKLSGIRIERNARYVISSKMTPIKLKGNDCSSQL